MLWKIEEEKGEEKGEAWRGERSHRGWDGWIVSLTQWTWVWANSRRWWRTGMPGVLQSIRSQRIRHALAIEQLQNSAARSPNPAASGEMALLLTPGFPLGSSVHEPWLLTWRAVMAIASLRLSLTSREMGSFESVLLFFVRGGTSCGRDRGQVTWPGSTFAGVSPPSQRCHLEQVIWLLHVSLWPSVRWQFITEGLLKFSCVYLHGCTWNIIQT